MKVVSYQGLLSELPVELFKNAIIYVCGPIPTDPVVGKYYEHLKSGRGWVLRVQLCGSIVIHLRDNNTGKGGINVDSFRSRL